MILAYPGVPHLITNIFRGGRHKPQKGEVILEAEDRERFEDFRQVGTNVENGLELRNIGHL